MVDAHPAHAEVCAKLHKLINVMGVPSDSEAAYALRRPFPELFSDRGDPRRLHSDLQQRVQYIEDNPGQTTMDLACAWSVGYKRAWAILKKLRRKRRVISESLDGGHKLVWRLRTEGISDV